MKLPKQLEKEGVEPDVRAALEAERIALPGASGMVVPVLKLTPKLRTNIFHAKSLGDLMIGYEAMAKALADELRGLRKTGSLGDRVIRLLMASNDGSPGFYRQLARKWRRIRLKSRRKLLVMCGFQISPFPKTMSIKGATYAPATGGTLSPVSWSRNGKGIVMNTPFHTTGGP